MSYHDGMTSADIPGNSQDEIAEDLYVEAHNNAEMFAEFLRSEYHRAYHQLPNDDIPPEWAEYFYEMELWQEDFENWLREMRRK